MRFLKDFILKTTEDESKKTDFKKMLDEISLGFSDSAIIDIIYSKKIGELYSSDTVEITIFKTRFLESRMRVKKHC